MHFGATLRILRVEAGFGLGQLARRIGVSSAYLSRVENGHDAAPTPDRLVAIARALDVPPFALLALARQAGAAVAGYVEEVPAAGALFLEVSRRRLGPTEIARVRAFVEREFPAPAADRGRPPVRWSEHLDQRSVVVHLLCSEFEDLIDVAVTRLPIAPAVRRRVAAAIVERERGAVSAFGDGVVMPHASVSGVPTCAALVTLARPLKARAADGSAVRLALILVGAGGRAQTALLTQGARLAAAGVADQLVGIKTARAVVERLASLEACL